MVLVQNNLFFHKKKIVFTFKNGLWHLSFPISQVFVSNQPPISAIPLIMWNLMEQKIILQGVSQFVIPAISWFCFRPQFREFLSISWFFRKKSPPKKKFQKFFFGFFFVFKFLFIVFCLYTVIAIWWILRFPC